MESCFGAPAFCFITLVHVKFWGKLQFPVLKPVDKIEKEFLWKHSISKLAFLVKANLYRTIRKMKLGVLKSMSSQGAVWQTENPTWSLSDCEFVPLEKSLNLFESHCSGVWFFMCRSFGSSNIFWEQCKAWQFKGPWWSFSCFLSADGWLVTFQRMGVQPKVFKQLEEFSHWKSKNPVL